jgi:hypothetical protein
MSNFELTTKSEKRCVPVGCNVEHIAYVSTFEKMAHNWIFSKPKLTGED